MGRRTIIGIDPGTNLLGFGVIAVEDGKPRFVDMGVLDLRKEKDAYSKLRQIFDTVSEVVKTYHGTEMALESPFYGKNPQVILKLGRAQGAAMIAALEQGLEVCEYAPREAKQAITGNGAASKEQVCVMLEKTLGVDLTVDHLDATDALAIALCHFYTTSNPLSKLKSSSSWEKFIQAHPDRVK
ncbi:MAG: crossover junction endodeoxyribonuclease RuvC [Bacteroidales bacterium]|nr:crossover junction endodeoxyribonuclease RuvC [Candidatus Cryptobacteroides faecihippi]MCQ2162025.1 crossover junction endodeoxyribonuclease RuvC [Bacteroidales bacterium]